VISPAQLHVTETYLSPKKTHTHATYGIRTSKPSKRKTADPRLRVRGHLDRPYILINRHIKMCSVSEEYINQCDEKFKSWRPISLLQSFLEKLTGPQLDQKFPAFYGTQRFIASLKKSRYMSRSRSIQSTPPSHFLNIHFNFIFPPWPRSSKWLHQVSRPNPVRICPVSHNCHMACLSHSSWFGHPNNIW